MLRSKDSTRRELIGDGGQLYLQIRGTAVSWVFHYRHNGKPRMIGLGSAGNVKLAEARQTDQRLREGLTQGKDPLAARGERRSLRLTVRDAADAYLEGPGAGLASNTHKSWRKILNGHVLRR